MKRKSSRSHNETAERFARRLHRRTESLVQITAGWRIRGLKTLLGVLPFLAGKRDLTLVAGVSISRGTFVAGLLIESAAKSFGGDELKIWLVSRKIKWWAWQGLNLRPLRCQHQPSTQICGFLGALAGETE